MLDKTDFIINFKMKFKWKPLRAFRRFFAIDKFSRIVYNASDSMVYKMWRKECNLSTCRFQYDHPEDFTLSHFQKEKRVNPLWVIYRSVAASYFVGTLFYTIMVRYFNKNFQHPYPVYLTNWTYILETLYFQLGLIIVGVTAYKQNGRVLIEPMKKMPWYFVIYWVLYTIVLPGAFIITLLFWVVIYDPEIMQMSIGNLIVHGLNSFWMALEFILVAHPLKLLHFYLPIVYAIIYILFSYLYQNYSSSSLENSIPIYKALDWRQAVRAIIFCSSSIALLLFIFLILCMLNILKVWLKKRKKSMNVQSH